MGSIRTHRPTKLLRGYMKGTPHLREDVGIGQGYSRVMRYCKPALFRYVDLAKKKYNTYTWSTIQNQHRTATQLMPIKRALTGRLWRPRLQKT